MTRAIGRAERFASLVALGAMVGCASSHTVDTAGLEASKSVPFELALVRVAGCSPLSDDTEKKTLALQKIPIAETLDVLRNAFGLDIRDNLAREVEVKERECGMNGCTCNNPQFVSKYPAPNFVSIVYSMKDPSTAFDSHEAGYAVAINAGEKTLFEDERSVAKLDSGGGLTIKFGVLWDSFIAHASEIDDVLAKHVKE